MKSVCISYTPQRKVPQHDTIENFARYNEPDIVNGEAELVRKRTTRNINRDPRQVVLNNCLMTVSWKYSARTGAARIPELYKAATPKN